MKVNFLSVILIAAMFYITACKPPSKNAVGSNNTAHTSMQSLDWEGTYHGILPCADCEGIETVITLNKDLTYHIREKYLGKQDIPFEFKGTFNWNKEGSKIILQGEGPSIYQVGENMLIRLDTKGNKITGVLADNYILAKKQSKITEKYWKLIEILGKPVPAGNNKEPHIILKSGTDRFNGTGGCNTFSGNYELKENNRILFSQAISTQMACLNMETEQMLLKVLETADSYILKGDTLILNRARMAPLARFEAVYLK